MYAGCQSVSNVKGSCVLNARSNKGLNLDDFIVSVKQTLSTAIHNVLVVMGCCTFKYIMYKVGQNCLDGFRIH